MNFLSNLWEKIKALFNNQAQTVDQAAIDEARAKRLEELNDPEDDFANDVAYDAKELQLLSRKAANRRHFRTGYYIFGTLLAIVLVAWGVIGFLTTPKPDRLVEKTNRKEGELGTFSADGIVEQEDLAAIRALVADATGDRNEDGQVVVEVTQISMPAKQTEENQSAFQVAYEDIEEALISPNVSLVIGRQNFLAQAEVVDDLVGETIFVSELMPDMHQNNPLWEYRIAARAGESKQAVLAAEVLAALAKK